MIAVVAALVLHTTGLVIDDPPATDASPPIEATPSIVVVETHSKEVAPASPLLTYKDGFVLQAPDGVNRIVLRGLVQPRLSLTAPDEKVTDWQSSFAVQRAQIELLGSVIDPRFQFDLKTEFGQGQAFVKDAYVDGAVVDVVHIRAGLFRRPFNREQLTPDWRLAFFERAITDVAFFGSRDVGVAVMDEIEKSPTIEYAAGVFAGTSEKPKVTGDVVDDPKKGTQLQNVKISNVPKLMTPTFAARLGYNSPGLRGYTEIDVDGGPLRWGVAGSAVEVVDASGKGNGATRGELDAIVKAYGVTGSAAVFVSSSQIDAKSLGQAYDATGAHVELGVLLFDVVHPGARYAVVSHVDGHVEQEALVNTTVLFASQNITCGVEVGATFADKVPSLVARTQAQLQF